MLVRQHRGGYQESMDTVVEVASMTELVSYFNKFGCPISENDVTFEHACYDSRNDWDTYYIMDTKDNIVLGMANSSGF